MPYTEELSIKTGKEGMYNITQQITQAVRQSGVEEGVAYIFCPHTTAAITVTENTDPNFLNDMMMSMQRAFPDYEDFTHDEDNAFAHVKSSMMGCEMFLLVSGAWPLLGPWQAVYFCEFDGPRNRSYYIKVVEC